MTPVLSFFSESHLASAPPLLKKPKSFAKSSSMMVTQLPLREPELLAPGVEPPCEFSSASVLELVGAHVGQAVVEPSPSVFPLAATLSSAAAVSS